MGAVRALRALRARVAGRFAVSGALLAVLGERPDRVGEALDRLERVAVCASAVRGREGGDARARRHEIGGVEQVWAIRAKSVRACETSVTGSANL